MRASLLVLAMTAILGPLSARDVSAQVWVWTGPSVAYPTRPVFPPPTTVIPSYGAPRVTTTGLYTPAYDYFAAPYPLPARLYAGYGQNDFPYYGRAYGYAYEPWTWEGMSRYPARPPLRVTGVIPPY